MRELPPGRIATNTNVSPSPRKKLPPVCSPLILSRAETTPKVSKTPAGMIAHQRSLLLKYTHQNATLIPAKKTSPSYASSDFGRKEEAASPSRVKPGNAAHQLAGSLNNM